MMSEFKCPDCGKKLKLMAHYHDGDVIDGLFHCESCLGGMDSDWSIKYLEDGRIEQIKRYYFG